MQRALHVTRITRLKPTTWIMTATPWRRSFGSCQPLCGNSDQNRGSRNNADPQVIALEQQLFDEYMIPGRYFQYFKTKQRKKNNHAVEESSAPQQKPLRPAKLNEYDPTPTEIQQRVAQRIQRGIATMYTVEKLPLRVSPSCLAIRSIKVARSLRKCRIYYEPRGDVEEASVHRSVQHNASKLETLIRSYAGLHKAFSVKFIPDTKTSKLEAIYEKISAELEQKE